MCSLAVAGVLIRASKPLAIASISRLETARVFSARAKSSKSRISAISFRISSSAKRIAGFICSDSLHKNSKGVFDLWFLTRHAFVLCPFND